jgi:hypothetical protein
MIKVKFIMAKSVGWFNDIFHEIHAYVKILSGVIVSQYSSSYHVVESIDMNIHTVLLHCFQL